MTIKSDLKFADVFSDPLWLLNKLLDKYKIIDVPTSGGWFTSLAGSGSRAQTPNYLRVGTGTTANSRGLVNTTCFALNPGDRAWDAVDYSKYLEWEFAVVRYNSDPEAVARVQLKQTGAEGALADVGLGVEIQDLDVYGEAYGTARQTVGLGTLTHDRSWHIKIVHVPSARVEFWVNGILTGILTGSAVPTGVTARTYMVISIINGSTGGVDANLFVGNIRLIQER